MKSRIRAVVAALSALSLATPALADALIDNVDGIALDHDGKVIHFTGLLMTPGGKITKLLHEGDKRPEKLDWRSDMHGKVMLPGFIDAHGHIMDLGFRALSLDLSDTTSLDQAKAKITAYIAANPDKKWILGGGWDQEKWGLGHFPTAADLDAVSQGRSIALDRIDSHAVWANTAAMQAAGVTATTKAPPGGQIESGVFVDTARALIDKAKPQPLARERDLAFVKAQQMLLADGITATDDMRTTLDDWLTFRRVADAGNLRLRIVSYAYGIETANRAAGSGPSPWLYDDKLRMVGVKLFADGALGSRGACLKAPYTDAPKQSGSCLLTDDQMRNDMSRAAMDGFQVAVPRDRRQGQCRGAERGRCAGRYLQGRSALADRTCADRRSRRPAQVRAARHRRLDAADPRRVGHAHGRGAAGARSSRRRLCLAIDAGERRAAGVRIGLPQRRFQPVPRLGGGRSRGRMPTSMPFGGWQPQHAITKEQAWRAYTQGAAYASFSEDRYGTLAPGMRADFIIVDQDPTLASPSQLRAHQGRADVGRRADGVVQRAGGGVGRRTIVNPCRHAELVSASQTRSADRERRRWNECRQCTLWRVRSVARSISASRPSRLCGWFSTASGTMHPALPSATTSSALSISSSSATWNRRFCARSS